MRALSEAALRALAYWPQIEWAAANHLTTADLWANIHAAADELGLSSPGAPLQGVNELRAMATRIQAASARLNTAPPTNRLRAEYRALAPWSRSQRQMNTSPMYSVRFAHTFMSNGEQITEWRTSVFNGRPPRTVGQLFELVDNDARNLAKDYGVEHLSADDLQLLLI